MTSKWFVFWIACWVIAMVKEWDCSIIFLIFAILTDDGIQIEFNKFIKK